jgi:succinoglycan biosynthesis transport protein ExoP
MEFEELLLLVRRRLALILLLGSCGLALSVYQTSKITPLFQSTATIFVSTPPGTNELTSGNKLGELATGNNFTQARVKSYATIINNPETLKPVIEELELKYGVQELADQVSATAPADTVLIFVKVINRDPELAAKIANSVASNFSLTVLRIELNSILDPTKIIKLSTVREAEPNYTPVSPRKNFNYFVGLFLGLLMALLISLLLKYLDKSIKSEKDLGTTPLLGVAAFDSAAESLPLISQLSTYAVRTEAFRLLRTAVMHLLESKNKNCIAVSSCFSGEGKTTTSLNLGLILAQAGLRVLVVEADLRRPGFLKYLKQSGVEIKLPKYGLSEILIDKKNSAVRKILKSSTVQLKDNHLEILFSGKIPDNPAELLGGENFSELVEMAKTIYDYVIIDTPPVLAVADASIVSRATEDVLLVMHAGKTSQRNFEAARESLLAVGVTLTGVMLNKIPKHKAGERYGYTYSDPKMGYYRYSYDYKPSEVTSGSESQKKLRKGLKKLNESRKTWRLASKDSIWNLMPPALKPGFKSRDSSDEKENDTESEFEKLLAEIRKGQSSKSQNR